MSKRIDLTGQKFGRLTVICYGYTSADTRKESYWKCECECGKIISAQSYKLRSGHTKSCGCYNIEQCSARALGHTWARKYKDGREATAHSVWKDKENRYSDGCSFETFLKLSQLPCVYCQKSASQSNKTNRYEDNNEVSQEWRDSAWFEWNGLDRVDPLQDHNEYNIVPCCHDCNFAKNDMTEEEFARWALKVYHYWAKDHLDKKRGNK